MEDIISENLIAFQIPPSQDIEIRESLKPQELNKNQYNLIILKIVKEIFTQLKYSHRQYYEPNNLWKYFQIDGNIFVSFITNFFKAFVYRAAN